jgi:anti-sigma factor RsiW
MMIEHIRERSLRLLLGHLSEEERLTLEEEILVAEDVSEAASDAETEAIDAYVRGELEPSEERHLEAILAASARLRERLATSRALASGAVQSEAGAAGRPRSRRVPAWASSLAAALVLVLGAGWMLAQHHRLERLEDQLRARTVESRELADQAADTAARLKAEEERSERLATALVRRLREDQDVVAASWVLDPGATRGAGGVAARVLPAGTERVDLQLELPGNESGQSFRAVVTGVGGEVWREEGLQAAEVAGTVSVRLSIPAVLLPPGNYSVELEGMLAGEGTRKVVADYDLWLVGPGR